MYLQHKEEEEREMYRDTSLHGDGAAETCRHCRSDLEREMADCSRSVNYNFVANGTNGVYVFIRWSS